MTREQYLAAATAWTHHHPHIEKPLPKVESPREGYELYPGWQILIMVTSRCNCHCSHCYLPFKGEFDPKELLDVIANFQQQGYNVYLNGAEPLLVPEYLKAFKLADQKIVMTNGLIICEKPTFPYEIREAGIETVGISYHFDIHERFNKKVPLSLAQTALELVELAGMKARVMTTVTRPYLEKIPEYCEWCVKHGFREIRFTNYMSQGRAAAMKDELVLTPDDRKRYYEIITQEREKYPKDVLTITSCGSFGACGTPNISCMAVHDFVVLTPDYKVYPCFFMAQEGRECGFYQDGHIFTKKGIAPYQGDCAALHLFNG